MYLAIWLDDLGQWHCREFFNYNMAVRFLKDKETVCYLVSSEYSPEEDGGYEKLNVANWSK